MIHYEHRYWGLPLLGRLYGSAFPRALLFASLAAVETALLFEFAPKYITTSLKNPTIFQIFGFVVGFALVFRSSLSYNRFWEARTMLQSVVGRLTYFTIETIAADLASMDHETASADQKRAAYRFYNELLHLVSLMFGLMVKHLRKDFDLSTMYKHDMAGKPPYMDSNVGVRGWNRWEVFVARVIALNDLFDIHNPQQQSDVPVIGGLRDEERVRLSDLVPSPGMMGRGALVNGARPYAIFALINQLYIRRIKEGGLQTHRPLVSRLGGIAEEAMSAFGHCSKLASTQFPFAWAQVVMAFLAIMALLLPFVVTNFVEQLWMGVVLSFIVVLTYWSLNEVASEMEDPFGYDPNDLPLARYAFDLNQNILAAVHQLRPLYFDELDAEEARKPPSQPELQVMPTTSLQKMSSGGSKAGPLLEAESASGGASSGGGSSAAAATSADWPDAYRNSAGGDADGGGGPGGCAGGQSGGGRSGHGHSNGNGSGNSSGGGSGTRPPDSPGTPLYAASGGASGSRHRVSTPRMSSSQSASPLRWATSDANLSAKPGAGAAAVVDVPAFPAGQRMPSASKQLSRAGSVGLPGEPLLEESSANLAAAAAADCGAGSAGAPTGATSGSAASAGPGAAAGLFATPFSRQASSTRSDSLRASRRTAVLPLTS